MENAVRLLGCVMALAAQGHILCSDLLLFRLNRNFRAAKKRVENVEGDLKGEEEKASKVFDVKEQVL